MPVAGTFMRRRHADAGEIRTDAGDIAIVRYREHGTRRDIPIRIDETSADYRTHALLAALRFEFQLLGGSETALRRHAPPARVAVLKIRAFDLMTRSAFFARSAADWSSPQSVETPDAPGHSSVYCDPPWHPGRQFLRLCGRDTR